MMGTAFAQQQGALNGLFTVNASGTQVEFSQGNLQYQASTGTWRFAEYQWDYVGSQEPFAGAAGGTVSGSDNKYISSSYSGWIDLFGWATSGYHNPYDLYNVNYQPWSNSNATDGPDDINEYGYGPSANLVSPNLSGGGAEYDWGVHNAISNGGNAAGLWRTLTKNEWDYLINTRVTPSGIRFAKATVNNVNGLILLPDNWQSSYYLLKHPNDDTYYYYVNTITAEEWAVLEQHGAVFLPAAGGRNSWAVNHLNLEGRYWSTTHHNSRVSSAFVFTSGGNMGTKTDGRYLGISVRLVQNVHNYSFVIEATASPNYGGTVGGAGTFTVGSQCTLTATPRQGYAFVGWTENGEVVSTSRVFTFDVDANRDLVANFTLHNHAGIINGLFTVDASGIQVEFSQGNLQFQASTGTWRFAEHQWDYVGSQTSSGGYAGGTVSGSDNNNISSSYSGWIDLFGWGTSGYHDANDPYNVNYQPWSTSSATVNATYNQYGYGPSSNRPSPDLTGSSANYDWGVYNAISNGSDIPQLWRALSLEEWGYLFDDRSTSSGIRFAKACVNYVNGVILLPDSWQASYYVLNNTNDPSASFFSNFINLSNWAILEQYGAVFLPAAGRRDGTSTSAPGSEGYYWSTKSDANSHAKLVMFDNSNFYASLGSMQRYSGNSVRLVRSPQDYSYSIEAAPSPSAGGTVSGAGTYMEGTQCTLMAAPAEGYAFVSWTENNTVVSTTPRFIFTVERPRTLVAHFEPHLAHVGAVNGRFTVSSAGVQVEFSQGNLQYQATTDTWRFAEHQYDYVGDTNSAISQTYGGWIDLFGWATSGYHDSNDPYNLNYQPWSISQSLVNESYNMYGYGPSMNMPSLDLTDGSAEYDWGVHNLIVNGGSVSGVWRTLLGEEWEYLLYLRNTATDVRFALACVNGVNGLVLLPDDWSDDYYAFQITNTGIHYSMNTISATEWTALEQHGAVFLPSGGYRYGTSVDFAGQFGFYWSSSHYNSNEALSLSVQSYHPNPQFEFGRYDGLSVRLVRPYQNFSYTIEATPNTAALGTVSGAGTYPEGSEITLSAMPAEGCIFVNWTENGEVVSANASYQFTVAASRTLVANFARPCPAGALQGVFSVGESTTVYFSQGNLQYIGSAETPYWKFADHQWDCLGATTGQNSYNQNVDRDLFGWGTSGYDHGANCYQPWSTSVDYKDYYAYGDPTSNLFDQTGRADWGYNTISNGGDQLARWRTLAREEWSYLFNTRATSSGIRYARACVNDVNGVILLPDDWQTSYYSLNSPNVQDASFSNNVISAEQWAALEQHGAVFLPAGGRRSTKTLYDVGTSGYYWSASYRINPNTNNFAQALYFTSSSTNPEYAPTRANGQSVRLVRSTQELVYQQEVTLHEGWNWWAPMVEGALAHLELALGNAGLTITAEDGGTLSYANGAWSGDIQHIALGRMYGIETSAACAFTLGGIKSYPVVVALKPGYNWFGCPCHDPVPVDSVFDTTYGPVAGDKVISQDEGFAIFNGTLWEGTLTTLQPGHGYVYVSQAQTTKMVTF